MKEFFFIESEGTQTIRSKTMIKATGVSKKRQLSISTLACGSGVHRPRPPIFQAILQYDWFGLHSYLMTGHFQDADKYCDSTMPPEIQAQKWVSYYDTNTQQKVKQLPLHAAIAHLAPLAIVELITRLYPEAVRRPDNNGNLPLHLAFMTNMKDVSCLLLKVYPKALTVSNAVGRLPAECHHHTFSSLPDEMEREKEMIESRAEEKMLALHRQIARDELQMVAAESELQDMKNDLERIQSEGRQRISRIATVPAYTAGIVDL